MYSLKLTVTLAYISINIWKIIHLVLTCVNVRFGSCTVGVGLDNVTFLAKAMFSSYFSDINVGYYIKIAPNTCMRLDSLQAHTMSL